MRCDTCITIGVTTLTVVVLIHLSVANEISDGRPDSTIQWLFTRLGEEPKLLRPLKDLVEKHYGQPVSVPTGKLPATCRGCLETVTVVKLAIRLGGTYESLRSQIIATCMNILGKANAMCVGLMDNYGPHVTHILRQTNKAVPKGAQEICELMNHCAVDIPESPATPAVPAPPVSPAERSWHPGADVMKAILTSQLTDKDFSKHSPGDRRRAHARRRRHMQRKATALRIVQVSDFHVDQKYAEGMPDQCDLLVCCRNDTVGEGSAGYWGEYRCNVPPRTIELLLRFAADELNPDFVIYSGDNPPHSTWEETYESQLQVMKWAANAVKEQIKDRKNISVYPAIGNHETMPTNLYSMDKAIHMDNMTVFNRVWEQAWHGLAGFGEEQKATILKAGYYTIMLRPGLRMVNMNSNYGYVDNFYNIIQWEQTEYNEMMAWFESTLEQARQDNEKVIMVTHHDIGVNIIEWDERFTGIMANYSDVIVFHPVGHTHRDEFRLYFGSDTTKPAGMVHVSTTMNSWSSVNPGFRVYYLDNEDYTVLDYDQYYMNLENATKEDAKPEKLYTFTEEYGLPDASADSYWTLWNRLRCEPELMTKYWQNRRLRPGANGPCDANCTLSDLCTSISQSHVRYLTCIEKYRDFILNPDLPLKPRSAHSSASTVSSTLLTLVVMPSVLLVAVLYQRLLNCF